ncbi:hypothetical protein [Sciscionella sediminilitoris]|uniref:hypothetical protein n=1 Tax=Sciscionella sediminilitoris TaxID=1445613 RepID=UPI0004DF8E14|nr:hypothetical protein [Sciscionella sp. SE31]
MTTRARARLEAHLADGARRAAEGDYRGALAQNVAATRLIRRLGSRELTGPEYDARMGFAYYCRSLFLERLHRESRTVLLERNHRGKQAITAARSSILCYEAHDPIRRGGKTVAEAIAYGPDSAGLRPAHWIAGLAEARSFLALLLGKYEWPGRMRDRELALFDLDRDLTIQHEVNVLDQESFLASKALVQCSRRTEDDHERMFAQNNEAMGAVYERMPDHPRK